MIDLYGAYLKEVQQALTENRGRTGSLPICGPSIDGLPATGHKGNYVRFTKPILVLTDDFTLSAAEAFSMYL